MLNILSIDLEDYFMVSAFEHLVKREDWTKYESRIERNTHHLLDLLDNCHPVSKTIQNSEVRTHNSSKRHSVNGNSPKAETRNSALVTSNLLNSDSSLVTSNSVNSNLALAPHNSQSKSSIHNSSLVTRNSSAATEQPQRATFFCLGWVAEHYPHLIREIHARGHEITSHGYDHRVITSLSPEEFRKDLQKSKAILEDLIGQTVLGYRAPSFSITHDTLWALEILAEEGFLYDSSIFPIHHDRYGIPNAPRSPFYIDFNNDDIPSQLKTPSYLNSAPKRLTPDAIRSTSPTPSTNLSPCTFRLMPKNSLIEFPLSTLRILGQNLPISGGGYFRAFPLRFIRWVLRQIKSKDSTPYILYIHPWEIDPDQPRLNGISYKSRFRHYINIDKTEGRLISLLRQTVFSSFRDFLNEVIGAHRTRSS